MFDYDVMTGRNLGFLTSSEQARLRDASVFVCGVGGMGGGALLSLARAGVGRIGLADPDRFELSNLNRQLLATLETVGAPKAEVARRHLREINPQAAVEVRDASWPEELDDLLPRYPVVVNGMDDVRAAIRLYRKACEHGATVIDAYTSPLPSVIRVDPDDPRPEERLGFPSLGRDPATLTDAEVQRCVVKELEHVVTHSSSLDHVDPAVAAEMLDGSRPRPSFAPVVLTAAQLMAGEALAVILGRTTGTDARGWFLDPWSGKVERPRRGPVAWIRGRLARRGLARLADGGPS